MSIISAKILIIYFYIFTSFSFILMTFLSRFFALHKKSTKESFLSSVKIFKDFNISDVKDTELLYEMFYFPPRKQEVVFQMIQYGVIHVF